MKFLKIFNPLFSTNLNGKINETEYIQADDYERSRKVRPESKKKNGYYERRFYDSLVGYTWN